MISGNKNKDGMVLLPNVDNQNCFGCSPTNASGLKMKFYINQEMDRVTSWLSVPSHLCGWANIVHGGVISVILDEAMGWAGLVVLRKLVVSKSISVDFVKPLFIGQEISAEGWVGNVNSEREAVLESAVYNAAGEICATSTSVASLFSIETLRKMGIADEAMLGTMERFINISSIDELKSFK